MAELIKEIAMTFDDITEDGRLRAHKSATPSKWREKALARRENKG